MLPLMVHESRFNANASSCADHFGSLPRRGAACYGLITSSPSKRYPLRYPLIRSFSDLELSSWMTPGRLPACPRAAVAREIISPRIHFSSLKQHVAAVSRERYYRERLRAGRNMDRFLRPREAKYSWPFCSRTRSATRDNKS